jgi:hypothetical protein
MMNSKRASVSESDSDLDVSGFAPKPVDRTAVRPEQVRAVSEAAKFQSREPQRAAPAAPAKREPRRHRTGRNMRLNIKARTEASDSFYAITVEQGGVLGETFEHAVEALERELVTKR